jgi:hypothetical protein
MSGQSVPDQGENEWLVMSSQVYWDHVIAEDFLRLAHVGSTMPDSGRTVRAWLFCYRQALELSLKSLIRAAESKWFDRSYRLTGSEQQHCNIESKLDHHRLGKLARLLDAHLMAVANRGITADVHDSAAFFDQIDPDGYRLRYGHSLEKDGFAETVPLTVKVTRNDLERIERAIASMLDRGDLALLTAARPVHDDGTECPDDDFAIPVRAKMSPKP